MAQKRHLARRFRVRRALEASLAAGGLFNFSMGVLLLVAPGLALGIFHLPRPEPGFYLQLLGLLVAVLGCYYALAASDVRRYSGAIALAICGRSAAVLVLLLASAGRPELAGLKALAAIDGTFALAHAISWWSIRS